MSGSEPVRLGATVRRHLGTFVSRAVEQVPGIANMATRVGVSFMPGGHNGRSELDVAQREKRTATDDADGFDVDDSSGDVCWLRRAANRAVSMVRSRGSPRAAWNVIARWRQRTDGES